MLDTLQYHCGKVPLDKREAQTKRNYLMRTGGGRNGRKLYIYQCQKCPGGVWHLTHIESFNGMENE